MQENKHDAIWNDFSQQEQLTGPQLAAFKRYYQLLSQWNEKIDLTAIIAEKDVVRYHFQDSLQLGHFLDLSTVKGALDIGSGAGFPGLPLSIKYPELPMTLLEVSHKRVAFLYEVIGQLDLPNVAICELDWRTFLRKTDYFLDLFVTRATLSIPELMRMFKPACPYKDATLVYWAAQKWQVDATYRSYVCGDYEYSIANRHRRLIVFKREEPARG